MARDGNSKTLREVTCARMSVTTRPKITVDLPTFELASVRLDLMENELAAVLDMEAECGVPVQSRRLAGGWLSYQAYQRVSRHCSSYAAIILGVSSTRTHTGSECRGDALTLT